MHLVLSAISPALLSGAVAVAVALVLLARGFRAPGPVRRVFALLALALGGIAAVLVGELAAAPSVFAWGGTVVGGVAVAALAWSLPAAATDLADRAADLDRLRLLEAAVTASGDGVMVAERRRRGEPGPRVVFANPAFEQIMGYSAEEVVGLSPSVFCQGTTAPATTPTLFDPDAEAEAAALDAVRTALRGTDPARLDFPGRRKDGSRVWAEWQVVPVEDTGGRIGHWVAVLRDTTERRQLEDQLRQSQKLEAVGRLAGGVAHDFNNLLTVILGNATLLQQGGPGVPAPELIDDIAAAADRAAALVRQLLTFSRRQPARPEVVDLNQIVVDLAGLLRRLLGERITVVAALADTPVCTRIDRGQIEQVVMNLVVNARDAMPLGGTLTIGTGLIVGPGHTDIVRCARLEVTDTGVGMTAAVKARIFEPFFTTKGPDKGTGLGLATVYGIVEHAGGRIGVESAPGAGATFRVDLPWSDDPPGLSSGVTPVPVAAGTTGRRRTVLLVEDEDAVRKFARVALEGHGYQVTETADGETALDLLDRTAAPDLLITDLSMPGIGGRELAGRVRAAHPGVGVVFVSGYAPDADRLGGLVGAVFLPKPFTPIDLLRAARRALNRAAVGAA